MRILITGAAGLYGYNLVSDLLTHDFVEKIIAVDDYSRQYSVNDPLREFKNDKRLTVKKMKFQKISHKFLDSENVDVVVHFAAFVSIPESMKNAIRYFTNNELGTFSLMQTLGKTKKQPFLIYASSPEVYGNPVYTPIDIHHPLYPRSIYAVTKLAAEKHCYANYHWYGYPLAIIRNFNTFGENQHIGRYAAVIPQFINNAILGKPIIVQNDGTQTRDFLYVKDAVRAYRILIQDHQKNKGQIFNIGTGKQTSIKNLAEKIKKISGSYSKIILKKGRSADLMKLEADITNTKKQLHWKPEWKFDDALLNTINWYKKHLKLSGHNIPK